MEEHTKNQEMRGRSYTYDDLPPSIQKSFTKNQDAAWRIHLKEGKRPKNFKDRLERAQNNIDFSIELLTYLINNDLLDDQRLKQVREILLS